MKQAGHSRIKLVRVLGHIGLIQMKLLID